MTLKCAIACKQTHCESTKNKTSFFKQRMKKNINPWICFGKPVSVQLRLHSMFICSFVFQFWPFSRCSVLLFPPLNSYRRFLIHELCEKFNTLGSFSISQGNNRRVVIYCRTKTQINNKSNTNSLASDER